MAFCCNCGAQIPDGQAFCTQCGTPVGGAAQVPVIPATDHTAEFSAEEVADGKLFVLLGYLTSIIGIIVIYLSGKKSAYIDFHIKQIIKLTVILLMLVACITILCWTIIVPILGGIAVLVWMVVWVISVIRVLMGKSCEAPIISSFKWL